jgi:type IV pilus assembly protein PilC
VIKVGERSGALGKCLHDIADMQEREVNAVTERLIGSLEPTLTLVIGGMLAWVVMAVLGPLYGSLSKLNGM